MPVRDSFDIPEEKLALRSRVGQNVAIGMATEVV